MTTRIPAARHSRMAPAAVGRTGSSKPTRPRNSNSKSCCCGGQGGRPEAGSRHAEDAEPLVGQHRDRGRELAQAPVIEMAQIGDRLRRALGRDDVVLTVGRPPDPGEGEQLPRQRVLLDERPVVVDVLGRCQVRVAHSLEGTVDRVQGVALAGEDAELDERVELLGQLTRRLRRRGRGSGRRRRASRPRAGSW